MASLLFQVVVIFTFINVPFTSGANNPRRWCYYTNWSQYRISPAKFLPETIDPFLCTHISYAFATIVNGEASNFEWNDPSTPWSKGMFERVIETKEKNPSLQIYLAIGGWNLGSDPFTEVVASSFNRKRFIDSAIRLAKKYKFDGIEIDWEYPAARGSPPGDKKKFSLLLKELRMAVEVEAVQQKTVRLFLAAAVSAGKSKIDAAYDIPEIFNYLDIINLMTYDFHGAWDTKTGHNSPLVPRGNEQGEFLYWNLESASIYWLQKGAPKEKLNIGVPTYGRTFTLADPQLNNVGDPALGPGEAGLYSNTPGFLAYYEICHLQSNGAQSQWDDVQQVPFMSKDKLWVSFDNVQSLKKKVQWIMKMGFGGVMIWSLDLDDHAGLCHNQPFPLIRSIYNTMTGIDELVTVPSETTALPQRFSCLGQKEGFYANQNDCTSFIYCKNGRETLLKCSIGQAFEPISKRCVEDSGSLCSTQFKTTLKTYPGFVKTGGHDISLFCQSRPNGRYDSPNACDEFIICFEQRAFPSTCPFGLFYDPSRKDCLYKDLVPCFGPTKAQKTTEAPQNFCTGKSDGFFADPSNCRIYHICRSGRDFEQMCGSHQIFKESRCIVSDLNC